MHRELHMVPVRLTFYRTPRSDKHVASSTSSVGVTSTPLIHPLNKPLCPIVCQATVLSTTEYQSNNDTDTGFGPSPGRAPSQVQIQIDTEDDTEEPGRLMHSPGASLFEELEAFRVSSWRYELQQLKLANQRLHEELHALEGACAKSGTGSASSTTGHIAAVPLGQLCSSVSTVTISMPLQPQLPQTQLQPSDAWIQSELKSLADPCAPCESKNAQSGLSALDPGIRQRCKVLGVLSLPSAQMKEEQEREVNREQEREREVELPPKAELAEHFFHQDWYHPSITLWKRLSSLVYNAGKELYGYSRRRRLESIYVGDSRLLQDDQA